MLGPTGACWVWLTFSWRTMLLISMIREAFEMFLTILWLRSGRSAPSVWGSQRDKRGWMDCLCFCTDSEWAALKANGAQRKRVSAVTNPVIVPLFLLRVHKQPIACALLHVGCVHKLCRSYVFGLSWCGVYIVYAHLHVVCLDFAVLSG